MRCDDDRMEGMSSHVKVIDYIIRKRQAGTALLGNSLLGV